MVVKRIISLGIGRGKPTLFIRRKAAVLGALGGDVPGTPPGSETRGCIHGGSLGTWEVQMLPWVRGWYKEIQRKAKSRRWGGMSRPSTSPALEQKCGRHKAKDGRYKVSGEDSEE